MGKCYENCRHCFSLHYTFGLYTNDLAHHLLVLKAILYYVCHLSSNHRFMFSQTKLYVSASVVWFALWSPFTENIRVLQVWLQMSSYHRSSTEPFLQNISHPSAWSPLQLRRKFSLSRCMKEIADLEILFYRLIQCQRGI